MRHDITVAILAVGTLAFFYGSAVFWREGRTSAGDTRAARTGFIVAQIGLLAVTACGVMLAQ